jgi:hypothetical protein
MPLESSKRAAVAFVPQSHGRAVIAPRPAGMAVFIAIFLYFTIMPAHGFDREISAVYLDIRDDVNLFYSETCTHCQAEMAFLDRAQKAFPGLKINRFDLDGADAEENQRLFLFFARQFRTKETGVPRTFIAGTAYVGFAEGDCESAFNPVYQAYLGCESRMMEAMRGLAMINSLVSGGGVPLEKKTHRIPASLVFLLLPAYVASWLFLRKKLVSQQSRRLWMAGLAATAIICLFIAVNSIPDGTILNYTRRLPFPLFVGIIALADGFNPCAFAIFFIFLSLLTYTRDKRDMRLVGGVFIIVSAAMYFFVIIAMVKIGSIFFTRYAEIILKVLGVAVLLAGLFNFKDFLFFRQGPSMTVSGDRERWISKRAHDIVALFQARSPRTLILASLSTAALAIAVNLIELGCSAILPAVYVASLFTSYGSSFSLIHVAWTALYAAIYVIPLLAILGNFLFMFRSQRVTEAQGRNLKLIGGIFMIVCGVILIMKPAILMFH